MQTVLEKKVSLIRTLSAEAGFILQYVQQEKIITTREYNNLIQNNYNQEKIVTKLLDMVMSKGNVMCCKFVDLLQQEEIQDNFPMLKELFLPAPTSYSQDNSVQSANELKDNLDELENALSKCMKELNVYKAQKLKNTSRNREHDRIPIPAQEESISLPEPHQEESISLPDRHQEESMSLSVPHQEESISLSVPHQEESISLPEPHQESISVPVDDCYPVTRQPSGYCLIINNYNFEKSSLLMQREVADRDALNEVFQRMHFIVEERRDLKGSDMQHFVKEVSEKDHSNMDVFVCCILSHGGKGKVLGVDGEPVRICDLTQPFALCSTLKGKPKLFFIQACQAYGSYRAVWQGDSITADPITVPVDFLIGLATVESYCTFCHKTTGTIYIQELCKYLKIGCARNEDILSILTRVNRSVSIKELNRYKKMPEPRYTLTKKLVLPMD